MMKLLPYGVTDFKSIRREGKYYVDKTMFLPRLEEENNFLVMLRPRRFGKSLFLSMMDAYYNVKYEKKFNELFGDLWIGKHPTSLANKYQIIHFDFSKADADLKNLEERFNDYCCNVLNQFIVDYKEYYEEITYNHVVSAKRAESKLDIITLAAQSKEYKLYLIIDEYDNFSNNILASHGREAFEYITHAEGFYRRFFKLFKGAFDRIFMFGVSPVTLDDLSSGYNIDWNISNLPEFNSMLGFEEDEVRKMLQYYKENGRIDKDVEDIIKEMKPWYDNYCFALQSYGRETVYNCEMALYYLSPIIKSGNPPEKMFSKNINMDYSKFQLLINLDKGKNRQEGISSIQTIEQCGYIDMRLMNSFPAKELLDKDNFMSMLYYYGMLTIGGCQNGVYHMIIPNKSVHEQYWQFLKKEYEKKFSIKIDFERSDYKPMFEDGIWRPMIERIGSKFTADSSGRDAIGGEHNVLGYFKALFSLSDYSIQCPEMELNYGHCDFLLYPKRTKYPNAKYCYIFEIKYVKRDASDNTVKSHYNEAESQLNKYTSSKRLMEALSGCTLYGITILFKGPDMQPPRIIIEKEIL